MLRTIGSGLLSACSWTILSGHADGQFTPEIAGESDASPVSCGELAGGEDAAEATSGDSDANRSSRAVALSIPVKCEIFEVKREHRLAVQAAELHAAGVSLNAIGQHFHADRRTVKAAIEFFKTNPVEAQRYAGEHQRQRYRDAKYLRLAPEVERLYREGHSLTAIGKQLGVTLQTVQRAYDHAKPDAIEEAIQSAEKPNRNKRPPLKPEVYEMIEKKLRAGVGIRRTARECGVDRSVVRRLDRKMNGRSNSD